MPAPLVIVAAAAAIGLGISYLLSSDARTRRALKKRRVTPIRGLRVGEVARVRGTVVAAEDVLAAPLTDRTCVYYLATVDKRVGGNGRWHEVAREERYTDFAIDDGTGTLHVCMSVPRVAVVRDVRTLSGTFDDANEREEALLGRHGLRSTTFIGLNAELHYREGVLEPGEEVTALGLVRVEMRAGQRVLVLDAPDGGPLLLSDDPRAVNG